MIFSNLQPHCAAIIGMRGSGKTVFTLNLLSDEFSDYFDHIVIISPTVRHDPAYRRKWINKCHIIDPTGRDLDAILHQLTRQYKDSKKYTLFLLDDMAFDNAIKSKKPALEELAFTSRHYGISIWIISQKYNSINKSFRDNLSWLALFYCKDKDSFENTLDENNVVPKNQRIKISNILCDRPHSAVVIKNDHPRAF